MPINTAQLLAGANYQLESYAANDPIDQVTSDRPLMKWLIANQKPVIFSNGIFNEKVRISNDSNYQNYTGDDQVTYNRRDTVRLAPYQHYEAHDGFALNETELANNGIVMTDDDEAVPTVAEKSQIVNILKEDYAVLKEGLQVNWDIESHLDGSSSPKAVPGLDLLVSTDPTTGVIGGIDAATAIYWRNNASMAISTATAGNLTAQMDLMWRACMKFGGLIPDFIPVGSKFYDAYQKEAGLTVNRQLNVGGNAKGGTSLDAGVTGLYYKGVQLVWDPTFDALDDLLGVITYPWAKRAYFLQSKTLILRPFKGRWMIMRKPARIYDRYTHYFGTTADYGITMRKRNANAVMSIA